LPFEGRTLVRRAAEAALETEPIDAVAVLGAEGDRVRSELVGLEIRAVACADWERGMGSSLSCGLAALSREALGVLVVLCDQPSLTSAHLVALRDAWRRDPEKAAASGYESTVGVPALVPRAWLADFATAGSDRGARDLLRARRGDLTVVVDEALGRDVDRPEDYR
jgi:molybdenum cofactor cytidylyltransferase